MQTINLPPYAPTLMESTRAIGYSIEAAIADIIDNSIAAFATQVDIDFFPIGESYISILDNGCGMSQEELIAAMQYGSRSPLEERAVNDLGRYGLGMKTASLSQCRILTVLTKKDDYISGAQWNLNHVKEAKNWSLLLIGLQEATKYPNFGKLDSLNSGTLIVWQDLDKFAIGENNIAVVNVRKSMWIHPIRDRALSIREAARLQTFPDSFIFKGTKDSQYQQVGNAVPPMLAKAIAEEVASLLQQRENRKTRKK